MVAFQISINGKTYCDSEDVSAITMVAEESPRRDGCRISLHAGGADSAVHWLSADLKTGDEIVIRIVETSDLQGRGPEGCSFCGCELHDVHGLVQGASAAICDRCIAAFSEAVKNGAELPPGASVGDDPQATCGVCGRQPGSVPGVIVRNGAALCPECLRGCADILANPPGSGSE